MYPKETPLFKELNPYSGQIDEENRWIKMAEMLPWDEVDGIYRRYFDDRKQSVIKKCRLIMGMMMGQMILEMSDRDIVSYFHENPYFQYFCGQTTFVARVNKPIIHPSLLSKRRQRLGVEYMKAFENEVLRVLQEKGFVKGKKLMLDATVFEANITYPNDVKLLNTVREWCCHTILKVKNALDPTLKIRTMKRTARKVYLQYQKTRKKKNTFIRKTKNRMLRFTKRNMGQLEALIAKVHKKSGSLSDSIVGKIENRLEVARRIYDQQLWMAKTRGKRVADRIVSFHQPLVRPMIRGKESGNYEFGIKAHVALVDGYAFLDQAQFDPFHEGNLLPDSVAQHRQRFGRLPHTVIADQLYATRSNRTFLKNQHIQHAFKPIGRPLNLPEKTIQAERVSRRKNQVSRNAIEGLFGHLKSRFNLHRTTWTVPNGPEFQVRVGCLAFNLHRAIQSA